MNTLRLAGVPLAAAAIAVSLAAPATADRKDDYLRPLLTRYSFLTSQQLLTEASRICHTIATGKASSDVEPMVSRDLLVSVPAAVDVIQGAVAYLKC